ncbi:MAG: hypothetical protein IKP21_08520, partial [Bacteroidales bacterium]|nr:hypothetical protein [Bacteroidales bacterium]
FNLMALCVGLSASAQISVYADDGVMAGWTGTITRSWGTDFGITYYWVGNQPYLDIADKLTLQIHRFDMPPEINIKDMFVDQATNTLYFCGTTASPHHTVLIGEGVLGRINLGSLSSIEWIIIPMVSELTKLVEYDNGGQQQVAAIGIYHWAVEPYTYAQYYFVDCPDASSALTMAASTQLSKFAPEERYYDIMLTDNYVVCFGYDIAPRINSICYRKTYKTNLSNPIFNDIHYFAKSDYTYSITHTTSLDEDRIITSYLYIDSTIFSTRLRTIDVAGDVMIHSQEYFQNDKTDPTDIVHIPTDNSVVVMHDFYFAGSTNSNFIYIDPFPYAPYTASFEFRPGKCMLSMTMHDSHYYLAGKGPSWFLKDKLVPSSGYPDPDCPALNKLDIDLLDNLVHLSTPYNLVPDPCICTDYNAPLAFLPYNFSNPCINQ